MLASLADAPLDDPQLVYEPKYDGIRAIVEIGGQVRLWSRLGNEKTRQFPEITAALEHWARVRKEPLVLDGEIVALDRKGEPTGFQQLQGRIHLTDLPEKRGRTPFSGVAVAKGVRPVSSGGVAFIAFDILRDGRIDFRERPLVERRAALERVFGETGSPLLRISRMVRGDGRALHTEALDRGWEGLIAKRADSLYRSGKRSPDWRKLKIVHEQEFVVGGWTEPRHTRAYFGALLLGVYDTGGESRIPKPRSESRAPNPRSLVYVGHTGTGFNEKELSRLMTLLKPLETDECPFTIKPKTNERPHWVRPELVAQIKFTEWTADARLRHPVYLGLRDDKKATDVRRERAPDVRRSESAARRSEPDARTPSAEPRTTNREPGTSHAARHTTNAARHTTNAARTTNQEPRTSDLIDQLRQLEDARRDGVLTLPGGDQLSVTNLHKVFWPKQKLTKGDLLRFYVRVAPFVLPAVIDRPLVMKRFPNGVAAPPFYQHRAPDVPAGVRTAGVSVVEKRPQIIGGGLKTLLYMTQLAAISQDPWFSRLQHPQFADYAAFDLDPPDGVPFARALDVARWIRDELDTLGALGVPKTSGSDGLHIYIPLPPGTPYDAGLIFCQIVATVVAQQHPKIATVERSVKARGKCVYIDCLQNILGKTLASAYSARASEYAGVSTPVTWQEINEGFDRRDFTIRTAPSRFETVGDLWAALRKSKGVDLSRVTRYAERGGAAGVRGAR
jgi:bifunctional non-homologous end joining protein LigD